MWPGPDRGGGAAFDALVTRADREPIPASVCATNACRTATVTGGDIRLNAPQGLLTRKPIPLIGTPGWAALGDALAAAEHGDASAFATPQATEQPSHPFASLAVHCLDFARRVHSLAGPA